MRAESRTGSPRAGGKYDLRQPADARHHGVLPGLNRPLVSGERAASKTCPSGGCADRYSRISYLVHLESYGQFSARRTGAPAHVVVPERSKYESRPRLALWLSQRRQRLTLVSKARRPFRVDAVEKGKNELTENFPCEPVETSIWDGSAAAHKELTKAAGCKSD